MVLLSWGLYIMSGTGRDQWFGVAYQRHVVGVGDCRLTGGGLLRWQEELGSWAFLLEESGRVSGAYKVVLI